MSDKKSSESKPTRVPRPDQAPKKPHPEPPIRQAPKKPEPPKKPGTQKE